MGENRLYWSSWEQFLQHWGMKEIAANIIESAGPLNMIAAHIVYLGKPLFADPTSKVAWESLADLLENPEEGHHFAAFLRREGTH